MLVEIVFAAVGSAGVMAQGFAIPQDSIAEAGFTVVLDDRDTSDVDGRDQYEVVSGSAYLSVMILGGPEPATIDFTCPAEGAYFRRNWYSGTKTMLFPNGCVYPLGEVDQGISFGFALPAPGPIGVPTLEELNSSAVTVQASFFSLPFPYESKYVVAYFSPEPGALLSSLVAIAVLLACEPRRNR